MAVKNLKYFQSIMREDIEQYRDRNDNIQKMKEILACEWDAPAKLKALDWWADVVTSIPADGVNAAVRTFATNMPSIRVFPPGVIPEELQRAEGIEDALIWSFRKANQRSIHRPIETSLEMVLRYGAVGGQVRYIPYFYKEELKKKRGESDEAYRKRTARIRAMRQQGDFTYVFHDVDTLYPRYSPDLLESMSVAKIMTVADIVREIGKENQGVKDLIDYVKSNDETKQSELEDIECVYYDYTDYQYRVRWASIGSQVESDMVGGTAYEFTREEHELDFLPWIYKECSTPLLQTVIDSKSYEHQNEMMSMYFAMMKAVVAHPNLIVQSPSGNGVQLDYTDPGGQVLADPTDKITEMHPRQMDQELPRQLQQGESRLGEQINTRALTALTDLASTTPFATINAMLQATVASLSDKRLAAEAFWEDAFTMQLRWINYSQIPLQGQRIKARKGAEGNPMLAKGSTVTLGGDAQNALIFDPDALTIKVKLREDTPTDRQTRLNSAFMLHKEGKFSMETCLEEFGLDDIEMDENAWVEEQMTMAVVQAKVTSIMQESDMVTREKIKAEVIKELQAQQQAAQKAQQQQQQGGGAPPQEMTQQNQQNQMAMGSQNAMAQGQQGGSASAQVAPQMTREQVTGQAVGGGQI
jgi:hypothetical protein